MSITGLKAGNTLIICFLALWRSKIARGDSAPKWPDFMREELRTRYNDASDEFAHSLVGALSRHSVRHEHFAKYILPTFECV